MAASGLGLVNEERARLHRAERILAVSITGVGLAGLVISRHLPVTASEGAFLFDVPGDYLWGRQLAFNPLGALLMVLAGLLSLAALQRRSFPMVVGAAGFALALAGAHALDLARSDPILGTRAGNVVLLLALGVGLATVELSTRVRRALPRVGRTGRGATEREGPPEGSPAGHAGRIRTHRRSFP